MEAFQPAPGMAKAGVGAPGSWSEVILATNIAESSITIDDVTCARWPRFAKSRLSSSVEVIDSCKAASAP